MYIGWYLYFAVQYIRCKKWKTLFQSILLIICGVATATVPFVIYFGLHGAITDWLTVYIYDNFFQYSSEGEQPTSVIPIVKNILGGILSTMGTNPLIPIMCIIAVIYFALRKMEVAVYLVASAATLLSFAFLGGVYHHYYSFTVNLFLPLGTIPFLRFLASRKEKTYSLALKKGIVLISTIACIAISALFTPNRYLMGVPKDELPQYKFASIIGTDGSATLLNYGFLDGGFHTVTNTLPSCKAFCLLVITPERLMNMQNECVASGAVEYIVTRGDEIHNSNYTCIASYEYLWRGNNVVYHLYQRT